MKLELVAHVLCPFAHRTAILLGEKGIEYERKNIDLSDKPDWFWKVSPRGKVPVLLADDVPLFDSSAINEFLDETHPPRLLSEDPFERARQRAWISVANDVNAGLHRMYHLPTKEESEGGRTAIAAGLSRFEEALETGVVKADRFHLPEIALAPALFRFVKLEEPLGVRVFEGVPMVEAWARRVAAHPTVVDTMPSNFVELFERSIAVRGGSYVSKQSS